MCTTMLKALQGQSLMTVYTAQHIVPYMAKSLSPQFYYIYLIQYLKPFTVASIFKEMAPCCNTWPTMDAAFK